MTSDLRWKLERLRSMSPAEVAWRLEERVSLAWLEAQGGRALRALPRPREGFLAAFRSASASIRPAGEPADFAARLAALAPGEAVRLGQEAAAIRAGRIELFARRYDFGADVSAWPWNRSPAGGPEIPLDFGPTLDYRAPERVGDARLAWEFARAGWSAAPAMSGYVAAGPASVAPPGLAPEPRLEGEANARFVIEAFEAFDRACPPYRGIQWSSALEFALRSLSWGWALSLVAAHPAAESIADERWARLFAAWAQAVRYVESHDSRHSSANNHRLGEAAGLAWAGHALAFLPEAARWRARGMERLEGCFLAQTTEQGITREHAFAYQQFVLDFVVTVEAVARRGGRTIPAPVLARIARVAESLDALSPDRAAPWPVGDGDEGRALHLAEPWDERVAGSLACAYALVGRSDAVAPHARALWLGLDGATVAERAPASTRVTARLPDGAGYAVERWTVGDRAARLLFDAAPLGLAPLYAHGHADALMVLLDVGGPRLVDAGTGSYHADPELRNRLRATRAHNTVEVDGENQSTAGGLFQWLQAAAIEGEAPRRFADGALEAAHTGYDRLASPVVHRRTVRILEPDVIVIVDRLEGQAAHRAVARWHVGDGVAETLAGPAGRMRVRWPDGFEMTLAGYGPAGAVLLPAPPSVWAPRFLEPRPCGVLELVAEARLPASLVTVVALDRADVESERAAEGWRLVVRTTRGTSSWLVCVPATGSVGAPAASGSSSITLIERGEPLRA